MAQQVRALGALAEDLGSIPRAYMADYNCNQLQGVWCLLLASSGTRHTYSVLTYIQAEHLYT